MPKILGLNLIAIIVATVVFFFAGFVIFGVLFSELWMSIENVKVEDAEAAGMGWLAPALLITLMQVVGIGLLLKWRGATSIGEAVQTAILAWLFLAVPITAYDPIYVPHASYMSLVLDSVHLFVGWVGSAVIFSLIK